MTVRVRTRTSRAWSRRIAPSALAQDHALRDRLGRRARDQRRRVRALDWHGTTRARLVAAFVAGAIPNWVLNRVGLEDEGRVEFGREIVAYVVISLLAGRLVGRDGLDPSWVRHQRRRARPPGDPRHRRLRRRAGVALRGEVRGLRPLGVRRPQPRPGRLAVPPPGVDRGAREPHAVAEVPALLGAGRVVAAVAHRRRHLGQPVAVQRRARSAAPTPGTAAARA